MAERWSTRARSVAILAALVVLASCEVKDPHRSDVVANDWGAGLEPHEQDIAYGAYTGCGSGSDEDCGGSTELDIYLPSDGGSVGTIVWLHGGGFHRGDKTDVEDFGLILRQTSRGFGIVSVNYRMTPPGDFTGVGFEPMIADVADSLDWVHTSGAAHGLNTDAVIVAGHSAGGTLAALAGTTANSDDEVFAGMPRVDGWLSVSGILDWDAGPNSYGWGRQWFADRFAELSDTAAPTNHFDGADPPGYLIHGADDASVEVANAAEFHDAMNPDTLIWWRVTVDIVDVDGEGAPLTGHTGHMPVGGAKASALDYWLNNRVAEANDPQPAKSRHFGLRSTAPKSFG